MIVRDDNLYVSNNLIICVFLKALGIILCVDGIFRGYFMYPIQPFQLCWLLKEEITLWSLYRFNSQPHLGLKAIYDLHYRASYELYADVLLVSIHHQCYQYNLLKRECCMIESSLTSQILSCLEIMRQSSQDCNKYKFLTKTRWRTFLYRTSIAQIWHWILIDYTYTTYNFDWLYTLDVEI